MRSLSTLLCLLVAGSAAAQTPDAGRLAYASRCAGCHGSNGSGGELGPASSTRVPARTDEELTTVIRQGLPTAGMPASPNLTETELTDLIRFCARSGRATAPGRCAPRSRSRRGGRSKAWCSIRALSDLQLLGDDRKIHLLRKSGDRYRPVTSQTDWPSYNGQTTGSRYSPLDADQQGQRRTAGAEVDLQPAEHAAAAGDAGRRRRRDVCHERQRVLRARRRQRAADLALPAPANQGADRQRRRRRQPRRGGRRRSRVHGDRSRAPHRAQSLDRRAAVGNRDGRLAPELQRDRRAAGGRQPGDLRLGRAATKACADSLPRSIRPPARKCGASGPCRAGRAGIGDVAGRRHRASRRRDVDDRHLRSGARHALLADRQSDVRISSATIGSATTSIPIRSSRSTRRPAS